MTTTLCLPLMPALTFTYWCPLLRWLADRPWGDVATWFGGLATFGAFIVAFKQIADERNARRQADEQSQALAVSAWMDPAHGVLANGLV